MRVLLDECLPKRLVRLLPGHEVMTVPGRGWAGIGNGRLLRMAADEFDAFVTIDQSVPFQQNLKTLQIGIVVLRASSNRLQELEPLAPGLLEALGRVEPGQCVEVGG